MLLREHLSRRLSHGHRQLVRSLAGVSEQDAGRGASPQWRRYRFGAGLDGSIAGIVRHVAAWKHVIAEGLETGVFPEVETVSPPCDWSALPGWFEEGELRLERLLGNLPPHDLEREVTLEGQTLTLAALFSVVIEHDHYHAGQVNLLRQQMGHEGLES